MEILAPCAGRVMAMSAVDDPVFAAQTVGPGVGITPSAGPQQVLAPADGKLLKLDPHAFILLVDGVIGILVHIGINTVRLGRRGFELLVDPGASVTAGTPIVAWNPHDVTDDDMSTTVVVAVMDRAPDSIDAVSVDTNVAAGDVLFTA